MTSEERIVEAEADLEQLLVRASNALPTLKRVADDASSWRKDITKELYENLQKACDVARTNQAKRRNWPVGSERRFGFAEEQTNERQQT